MLDKPKLTCALNKKNPQKISHIFWGFFFYAYGIITFAYPYLSTIFHTRQRSLLPFQSHASS